MRSLFVVAAERRSHRCMYIYFSALLCLCSFQAAQRELERQRKEEWERRRRGELQIKKEQEQDDIIKLKAKKRSLEMELEAVVSGEEAVFISVQLGHTLYLSPCLITISLHCFRVTNTVRYQTDSETFRTRRSFRGQSWI